MPIMKDYNIYIFDLDGTITNTMTAWAGILRDCLLHFNITPPDDRTVLSCTHDWKEVIKLGLPADRLDAYIQLAHKLANERLKEAPLHVGAYETLEALKNHGKRIAIFSTMDRPIFVPVMEHRNLDAIAEVAVAGTDVDHRKPHPAGILKALQDLGVPKEAYKEAVYIGDKDTDIQAAHNAGVDSILYYPAAHQLMYDLETLKQHKPTHIIYDWQELLPA